LRIENLKAVNSDGGSSEFSEMMALNFIPTCIKNSDLQFFNEYSSELPRGLLWLKRSTEKLEGIVWLESSFEDPDG